MTLLEKKIMIIVEKTSFQKQADKILNGYIKIGKRYLK